MRKGFTLIELIVVIAIIAILAAIIAPNAFKAIEKASRSATLGDLRTIKTASMSLYADTGEWPTTGCDETLLVDNTCDPAGDPESPAIQIAGWDGPYIEQFPSRTRWGGVYTIREDDNLEWSAADGIATAGGDDEARYTMMNDTPVEVLQRLDIQIDGEPVDPSGTDEDLGSHRWDIGLAPDIESYSLISTDVPVLN